CLYNAAVCIDQGNIIGLYRKHILPNYQVFDEKRYFEPGHEPLVVTLKGVRFGITVCEDIWQEAPARLSAQAGAQVLININASPFSTGKLDRRLVLLKQRAISNQLPIV